jgi:hypothetical protein
VKLDDGREVLCTLALPLPLALVGALGEAIATAAEEAGYDDVNLLTDGTNRVVARQRERDDR